MAWKIVDLDGTKNGSNAAFSVPFTYLENTLTITHNNAAVYIKSSGTANAGEAIVVGSSVTMGTPPDSTDTLWCRGFQT